jgi:hypothetical protein
MKTSSNQSDKLDSIHSNQFFEIRLNSGTTYFGHLSKSVVMVTGNIITVNDTIPIRLWDIVLIITIKVTFLQKIAVSLDFVLP